MSTGPRDPGLNARFFIAVTAISAVAVAWGTYRTLAFGDESIVTGVCIGVGGLLLILGFFFSLNFIWGARIAAAMRGGRGVIARWTVPHDSFEHFRRRELDLNHMEAVNDYSPPRTTPATGIEIIFSQNAVLIGQDFFGLHRIGLEHFTHVRLRALDPSFVEFGTMTSMVRARQTVWQRGVLRVPVAPDAQAQADTVVRHFEDVLAGRTIVNPNFWPLRIRIGLVVAVVSLAAAGVSWVLLERENELHGVPSILLGGGIILGGAGLILAGGSWGHYRNQRRGQGS